ncbi:Unknown protein, partial [Striga hermonthica]
HPYCTAQCDYYDHYPAYDETPLYYLPPPGLYDVMPPPELTRAPPTELEKIVAKLEEDAQSLRASLASLSEKEEIESFTSPSPAFEHPSVGQPRSSSLGASFHSEVGPIDRHQEVFARTQDALASLASIIEEFNSWRCIPIPSALRATLEKFDSTVVSFLDLDSSSIPLGRYSTLSAKLIRESTRLESEFRGMVDRFVSLKEKGLTLVFISGLSEELQSFIHMFNPRTLQQTIELGQKQLHTLEAITKKIKGNYKPFTPSPQTTNTRNFSPNIQNTPLQPKPISKIPTKLLSAAEMAARRERGLCYNCDEKFVPGHRCKYKINYMIMAEEEELEHLHFDSTEDGTGLNEESLGEEALISLNAMMGEGGPNTLKFFGYYGGQRLLILLDTGSTLSFIKESTAKQLGCQVSEAKSIVVKVASGQKLKSSYIADNFTWRMQGSNITYPLRLLQSEGCDVILGGDWLRSCTPIELDYKAMTVTVSIGGKRITLQALKKGAEGHLISGESLHQLMYDAGGDQIEELYLLTTEPATPELEPSLASLLQEFEEVFLEPQGLPPERGVEHQIILKPGSTPKFQYPYRTSHDQKDAIEEIVRELLEAGVIQNSKSPFASPVLLVKKKDMTWRLCVDFRYLNSLTVKHEYPIPVIEELLDELCGARYFSKVDLRSGYFQILMNKEHRFLTAFRTHSGHYEFLVMPFGLCNAPATFQSLMNQVFSDCLRKF